MVFYGKNQGQVQGFRRGGGSPDIILKGNRT